MKRYSIVTYADRQLMLRLFHDGLLTTEETTVLLLVLLLDLVARVDREEERYPPPLYGTR